MTFDQLQRECRLLHEQLQAESKAREEAAAKARISRRR